MALILDGTNGLSDVDGSAATPAIRGSDTNTGVFFGSDVVGLSTGGAERVRVDASGNVGIGTSSPGSRLQLNGSDAGLRITGTTNTSGILLSVREDGQEVQLLNSANGAFRFGTNNTERMRIDSSGNVFINSTNFPAVGIEKFGVQGGTTIAAGFANSSASNPTMFVANTTNGTVTLVRFSSGSGGNTIGNITGNSTNTTYATSSDYRLKEDVAPMTGALAKVQALKPVTYTWKTNGSAGQGFIAHELQEVVPECVTGEKDAVDADGNPQYQGIDTSFLSATLTAALQELHQIVQAQAAEIAELKAKLP
jgi:hypothetical protein